MQGMTDLGQFGDERLKKRGPIFWRRSRPSARLACGGSAATGRRGGLSALSAQRGGKARDHALDRRRSYVRCGAGAARTGDPGHDGAQFLRAQGEQARLRRGRQRPRHRAFSASGDRGGRGRRRSSASGPCGRHHRARGRQHLQSQEGASGRTQEEGGRTPESHARSRPRNPAAGSGVCGRRTSRCRKRRW